MSILVIAIATVIGVSLLACVGLAGMCSVCLVVDEGDDMFCPSNNPTENIYVMQKKKRIQEVFWKRDYDLCRVSK